MLGLIPFAACFCTGWKWTVWSPGKNAKIQVEKNVNAIERLYYTVDDIFYSALNTTLINENVMFLVKKK